MGKDDRPPSSSASSDCDRRR
uniref:Uncharacterized protein n=1 Tax=Anguilla anguilla TaxID=7936 RepID=A0A0E9VWC8_ANGAN